MSTEQDINPDDFVLYTQAEPRRLWFYITYKDMICESNGIHMDHEWDKVEKLWSMFDNKYQTGEGVYTYSDEQAGPVVKDHGIKMPLFIKGTETRRWSDYGPVLSYCKQQGLDISKMISLYEWEPQELPPQPEQLKS